MNLPADPRRARFLRRALQGTLALATTPLVPRPALAQRGVVGSTTDGPPRAPIQAPIHAPIRASIAESRMRTRPIPSTGEPLPVIGCGTWQGFDVPEGSPAMTDLAGVVAALFDAGGSVLDSSPMYGRSEAVTGRLLADPPRRAFVATKVWTEGRDAGVAQMERSIGLLGHVDLMQVHNLSDWKVQLSTLRRWKAEGRIRYVGVTHYTASAYRELESVMRGEALDFVQVDYALDDRDAADRILPLAADRGVAVLINRPFGGGGLLRRLAPRPLPDWAAAIGATTWSQVLLGFVLSHPAVTCVIPGTGNPAHMADNARAGFGDLPDRTFWDRRRIDAILATVG